MVDQMHNVTSEILKSERINNDIKQYIKVKNDVVSPVHDTVEYFYKELSNKLQIFLINDPESSISSALMYVGVGSNANPEGLDGLAHYLEHMLFMGSDKYPGDTYFQQQVSTNSGFTNAFTTDVSTQYYFTVGDNFMNLLEVFSRFFVKPMFEVDHVDKEVNAVDSEHKKNIGSDGWRMMNISKQFFTDGVVNRFTTGTKDTLLGSEHVKGDPKVLREKLVQFYEQHYSSDKMILFVSHKIDKNTMDEIAVMFKDVPLKTNTITEDSFTPRVRELTDSVEFMKMQTVNETHFMSISWLLPGSTVFKDGYPDNAYDFLAYILNSTNEGSLYNVLKKLGVVTSVVTGIDKMFDKHCFYEIQIRLTEEGVPRWINILYLVDAYIRHLLNACEYSNEMFDKFYREKRNLTLLHLQTIDKTDGMQLCQYYADTHERKKIDLRYVPIAFGLVGSVDICRTKFKEYLKNMTLERAKVTIYSPLIDVNELDKTDPFYNAKYCHKTFKIDQEAKQNATSLLEPECVLREEDRPTISVFSDPNVPKPNPFIEPVYKIDIIDPISENDGSYRRISSKNNNVYFLKKGNTYKTHSVFAELTIRLDSMVMYDPDTVMMIMMYCDYVEKMRETDYQNLRGAQTNVVLVPSIDGITVVIDGYNSKFGMDNVFETVLGWYYNNDTDMDINTYEMVYDELMMGLQNYRFSDPYTMIGPEFRDSVNGEHNISNSKMISSLKKISPDVLKTNADYSEFKRDVLSRMSKGFILGVFGGSITVKQVDSIIEKLETVVRPTSVDPLMYNIDKKDLTKDRVQQHINPNNAENAIGYGVYLGNVKEVGEEWKTIKPICMMLEMYISDRFSAVIRTERQIGYVAVTHVINVNESNNSDLFLLFIVQSTRSDLRKIVSSYVQKELMEAINKITEDEFETMRQSVITILSEKPTNIMGDCATVFNSMANTYDVSKLIDDDGTYAETRFARKKQMCEQLKHIKLKDFVKFISDRLEENVVSVIEINAKHTRMNNRAKSKARTKDLTKGLTKARKE